MADSVSDPECAGLFIRISDYVDLKGADSDWEMQRRFSDAEHKYKTLVQLERAADEPRKWRIKRLAYQTEQLNKLVEKGFAERFIGIAIRNPRGIIAQIIHHGKRDYKQRIVAQKRAMARAARAYPTPRRRGWTRYE